LHKKIYYTILRTVRSKGNYASDNYFATQYKRENDPEDKYLSTTPNEFLDKQEITKEESHEEIKNLDDKIRNINKNFKQNKISKITYDEVQEHIKNNSLLEDLKKNKNKYKDLFTEQGIGKIQESVRFSNSKSSWQDKEANYWERLKLRSKGILSRINMFFGKNYDPDCFWWVMAAHCFPKNRAQENINVEKLDANNSDFDQWLINFVQNSCIGSKQIELHHSMVEDSAIRYYLAIKELENLKSLEDETYELKLLLDNIWDNLRNNYSMTSIPLCQNHHQPNEFSISDEENTPGNIHGEQAKWGSVYDLTIPTGYSFEEIVNGALLWWITLFNNEKLQDAYGELFENIQKILPAQGRNDIKRYLNRIMAAYYHSYQIYWDIEKTVVLQRFNDLLDLEEFYRDQKIPRNGNKEKNIKSEISSFLQLLEEYGLYLYNDKKEEILSRQKDAKEALAYFVKDKEEFIKNLKIMRISRNPFLTDIIKIMTTYFPEIGNRNTPLVAISLHRYYKNISNILTKTESLDEIIKSPMWINSEITSDDELKEIYKKLQNENIDDAVIEDFQRGRKE